MEDLVDDLEQIQGVKNVGVRSGPTLRINLFSKPIPRREAEEIRGNLRKISPKISDLMEKYREDSGIKRWNWIQKPKKQYDESSLQTERVNDRKSIGHKPPYYTISIEK